MSKTVTISYSNIYTKLWENLIRMELVPEIFPPTLNVNFGKDIRYSNKPSCVKTASFDALWTIFDQSKLAVPVKTSIQMDHYSRMALFSETAVFGGLVCPSLQCAAIIHDMIHELCHFLIQYELWMRCHSDSPKYKEYDFDKSYSELVEFLSHKTGTKEDEFHNETYALRIFSKVLGLNDTLVPKYNGRYCIQHDKCLEAAILRYYTINNMQCHTKLSADEYTNLTKEAREIAAFIADNFSVNTEIKFEH